jgi:hypothetical protein
VIADVLKGTVDESLKKLVQPAAVVPATLFVLLNLGFIYPEAKSDGAAKAFSTLDKTWQAVVAGAVILALGYLLLNAANMIIDVLAGQSWRQSGLNWVLRKRQLRRRRRLERRIEETEKADKAQLDLRWQLATYFPSSDPDKTIQATRLGNVLVANQHSIWKRYGLDIVAFWSPMEANKELKDAPAIITVKDEKSTLDLLANLVFVLALFGVEALIFFAVDENWSAAVLSLLALLAAYVTYRIAVESARSWCDAIQDVLDLHRGELRKSLGLREPKGIADECELWKGARHLYLPGDNEAPPADLFEAKEPATLKITSSAALKVEKSAVAVVDAIVAETASPPADYVALLRFVDYSLIASRVSKSGNAGLDVAIDDPRVRRVQEPDSVDLGGVKAEPRAVPVGDSDQLQWRITRLEPGGSLLLAFRLPLWRLTFECSGTPPLTVTEHSRGVQFAFGPESKDKNLTVELESFAPDTGKPPRLVVNGEEHYMTPDAELDRFTSGPHTLLGADKVWIELPEAT